jgi:RNA-directed DNA polymerase
MGEVISPLLANVYLNEFDKWAAARWDRDYLARQRIREAGAGNYKMVRYADDFVVVSNDTLAGVQQTKQDIKQFLEADLHLTLSDDKTLITHVNDGFTFLGFQIQRVRPEGRWVVHLRPSARAKDRIKERLKDLTSRGWTWMDEYRRLVTLNAVVRGWAEYYRYTSLVSDIEEITRYVWHRYLLWLLKKHKGSRKHQLVVDKTRVLHNRTRWHAEIREGNRTLKAYQWLPTSRELHRRRYPQKGRLGFPHPYLFTGAAAAQDYPMGETGPDESLYTSVLGVRDTRPSRDEPLDMGERKLRAKMRDGFKCVRCGAAGDLQVHHTKGTTTHDIDSLETLCRACHHAATSLRQRQAPDGEPDAAKVARPVRREG